MIQTVCLLDRVRVVQGPETGNVGRIVSMKGETLAVVNCTRVSAPFGVFYVESHQVEREFRFADAVKVVWGADAGKMGFVARILPSGVLEVQRSRGSQTLEDKIHVHATLCNFNTADDFVGHQPPLDVRLLCIQEIIYRDWGVEERQAAPHRYDNVEVLVGGQGEWKGVSGRVCGMRYVGAQETVKLVVAREASQQKQEFDLSRLFHLHSLLPLSIAVVVLTPAELRGAENSRFVVPETTTRPSTPPPDAIDQEREWTRRSFLPGEDNGEWLMLPGLVGKRFDVQIVDVQKHHKRPAQKLLSFEGKHGYIALNTQVDHQMLQSGKVPVGGSQMSATNVKISPKSIRPSRQISDEDPRPLTEASSRVIVIGPDREGQATKLGCYGLTQPEVPHKYGSDTVAIRFPAPQEPIQFFNLASLCCSANIHLNDNFPATNFPSAENKRGQVNDWLSHPSLAQKRMDVKTRDGRCGYLLLEVALSGETARVTVYFDARAGNHDDINRSHIYPIHPTSNSVERTLVIAQDAHGGKNRLGKYAKITEETSPGVVEVHFQGRYDGKAEFPLMSLCVAKNEECWSKTRMRFPQTQFFQSERHLTQDVAVIADWLSKPCIVGKHLDVWIDNALPFHLLIDSNVDLTTDELYAYNPSRPATCRVHRSRIQPRRPTGDERERVVVLGPNIERQMHGVGEYAEVVDFADGVCAVRLHGRYDEVERYSLENLCVAQNEEGRSLRRNVFPPTKFVL